MENSSSELLYLTGAALLFGGALALLNKMGVLNFGEDWAKFVSFLQGSNQNY